MDDGNEVSLYKFFLLIRRYVNLLHKTIKSEEISFELLVLVHYDIDEFLCTSNLTRSVLPSTRMLTPEQKEQINEILNDELIQLRKFAYTPIETARINYLDIFKSRINTIDETIASASKELAEVSEAYQALNKRLESSAYGSPIDDLNEFEQDLSTAKRRYEEIRTKYKSLEKFKIEFVHNNMRYFSSRIVDLYTFYEDNVMHLVEDKRDRGIELDNQTTSYFDLELIGQLYNLLKEKRYINCTQTDFLNTLNLSGDIKLSIEPSYLYYSIINSLYLTLGDRIKEDWLHKFIEHQGIKRPSYRSHYGYINGKNASKKMEEIRTSLKNLFEPYLTEI